MKKLLVIGAVAVLAAAIFAGCRSNADTLMETTSTTTEITTTEPATADTTKEDLSDDISRAGEDAKDRADKVGDDVRSSIDSYKHSKNYMLGLHGFSNYRLVVIESSTGTVLTNRRGRDLRDFVQRIMSGT